MKNTSFGEKPAAKPQGKFNQMKSLRMPAGVMAMAAMLLATTACSPKTDDSAQAASVTASNVTLTAEQRQHIRLYTAAPSSFHKTVDTTGTVDFDNDQATGVLAPISGPVSRLLVAAGDRVKKGQPLAIVDSPDFATAISAYRKALATAHTARRLADLDKDLLQHQGVAQREEDQAQSDAANAEADAYAALQTLVSLDVDPKTIKDIEQGRPISHVEGVIRSPIVGTVAEKLITPGQLLQAGTTACFTVADLSRVWVMAQVPDADLASIALGDPVDVATGVDTQSVAGTVDNIGALVNPDTRMVLARVLVENTAGLLRKQMYVSVRIHSRRQSTGMLVPVSAILRDDENLPFVYVADSAERFAQRHVTLGERSGDQYVIAAGLKGGERIVVDGGIFVQFMQNQ